MDVQDCFPVIVGRSLICESMSCSRCKYNNMYMFRIERIIQGPSRAKAQDMGLSLYPVGSLCLQSGIAHGGSELYGDLPPDDEAQANETVNGAPNVFRSDLV